VQSVAQYGQRYQNHPGNQKLPEWMPNASNCSAPVGVDKRGIHGALSSPVEASVGRSSFTKGYGRFRLRNRGAKNLPIPAFPPPDHSTVSEPNAREEHEQADESEQKVITGSWWDYFDCER